MEDQQGNTIESGKCSLLQLCCQSSAQISLYRSKHQKEGCNALSWLETLHELGTLKSFPLHHKSVTLFSGQVNMQCEITSEPVTLKELQHISNQQKILFMLFTVTPTSIHRMTKQTKHLYIKNIQIYQVNH